MFPWKEFLSLARELAKSGDEAAKRTAISRAYYAAFHTAREWVRYRYPEVRLDGQDSHAKVWDQLKTSTNRLERAAQQHGVALKDLRQKADYDARAFVQLNIDATVNDAIHKAEVITAKIAEAGKP